VKSRRAGYRRHLPSSPFAQRNTEEEPVEQFAVRDQVTHDQYGLGVIVGVEDGVAVLVDFRPQQVRIKAPYDKMTKL
jgi:hypothetical protein